MNKLSLFIKSQIQKSPSYHSMTKTTFAIATVLLMVMLSITLTAAHADTSNPISFEALKNQLTALTETLFEQKCVPGMVVSGIDSQGHVVCEDKGADSMSVIPFTTADMGYGTDTEYVGTGHSLISGINPIIVPADGTITNLVSRSNITPDPSESFIVTLLKNGKDTQLSCTISSGEKTCNDVDSVTVHTGDAIEAKITSTVSTDPEPLYVNTSILFAQSN